MKRIILKLASLNAIGTNTVLINSIEKVLKEELVPMLGPVEPLEQSTELNKVLTCLQKSLPVLHSFVKNDPFQKNLLNLFVGCSASFYGQNPKNSFGDMINSSTSRTPAKPSRMDRIVKRLPWMQ